MFKPKAGVAQRLFILEYLKKNSYTDIYDDNFHRLFHKRFGGKRWQINHESIPVRKSQSLLSRMYKEGVLNRQITKVNSHAPGLRNWVYGYTIKDGGNWF